MLMLHNTPIYLFNVLYENAIKGDNVIYTV